MFIDIIKDELGTKLIPITIQNCNWNSLSKHITDIKIQEINETQILVTDSTTKAHLSLKTHSFVVSDISREIKRINVEKKEFPGIILEQENDNYQIISYITYENKRKIIGIYKKDNGFIFPIAIHDTDPSVDLEDLVLFQMQTRDPDEKLGDIDLIYCENKSKKILRIAEKSKDIKEFCNSLMNLLLKTSDLAYVMKIMDLHKCIAYRK